VWWVLSDINLRSPRVAYLGAARFTQWLERNFSANIAFRRNVALPSSSPRELDRCDFNCSFPLIFCWRKTERAVHSTMKIFTHHISKLIGRWRPSNKLVFKVAFNHWRRAPLISNFVVLLLLDRFCQQLLYYYNQRDNSNWMVPLNLINMHDKISFITLTLYHDNNQLYGASIVR